MQKAASQPSPVDRLLKDSDGKKKYSDGRTAREESMEKLSSTFKKMHGLQKSYNIHMKGRMGKFRIPVWKTSLALVPGASVYQPRLFTWALGGR